MTLELDDGTRLKVAHVSSPEVEVRNGNAVIVARLLFTSFRMRESAEYYCSKVTRALTLAKKRKAEASQPKPGKVTLDVLKICRRLEELGMSRSDLAAAMKSRTNRIGEWLKGLESKVRFDTAERMAKALGCTLDEIRRKT